jgi:predicted DNA-binding mobile mystery protein A
MDSTANARHRLDERFERIALRDLPRPHRGWIRAVRDALGMSAAELGTRLGVSQQSVAHLERSERRHSIRLDSLQRAARAMDCEVVYAIVPRGSLDETVRSRARHEASRILAEVGHHSRLENQAVTDHDLAMQIDELTARLVDTRGLWTDDRPSDG